VSAEGAKSRRVKNHSDKVASNTFRAFSAGDLQVFLPGPLAQAITFRAFGAECGGAKFEHHT